MRKTAIAVVSVLVCIFSAQSFAKNRNFQSVPHLSNLSLEQLAVGFDLILRNDVTPPYNGEWGYVSRTNTLSLKNEILIEHIAFSELCAKLRACPDSVRIVPNTHNEIESLVNFSGLFLFQQREEEKQSEYFVRKKTFAKLRTLIAKALKDQTLKTYIGYQQTGDREGGFAAFFDPAKNELLIIGSNTRP